MYVMNKKWDSVTNIAQCTSVYVSPEHEIKAVPTGGGAVYRLGQYETAEIACAVLNDLYMHIPTGCIYQMPNDQRARVLVRGMSDKRPEKFAGNRKSATDAMREDLKGICDFEVRLPVDRAPRGRREEQLRMASNQGAEIAWLVMAETFGYGRDRLARLKQNSMNNYKQYLEWEKEDKDLALDRLRRCVQDALKEDLRVTDIDDRKGMLSTPGRGPSVYETAAVYSEIFRRARAGRAVAPLAVYSAAKYDETMTAARKRASVMLGL